MYLGIVAQRLIVADALHRPCQRLFIQNAALAERHGQPEPLLQDRLQNFQLHLAQVIPPVDVQLRVLALQRLQRL